MCLSSLTACTRSLRSCCPNVSVANAWVSFGRCSSTARKLTSRIFRSSVPIVPRIIMALFCSVTHTFSPFLPIPSRLLLYLGLWSIAISWHCFLEFPPLRNSNPGSNSRHSSPAPHYVYTVRVFVFVARITRRFLPSSTRVSTRTHPVLVRTQ